MRRSIDFVQTARGCVVQYSHKLSLTSRRDAAFQCLSPSPQVSLTAKVRSSTQRTTRKRQSRRKPLRSKSNSRNAHSLATSRLLLARCALSLVQVGASTKSLSLCSSTKSQAPAGGTTSGSRPSGRGGYHERVGEGETPLDLLRCCVRLTI